MAVDEIKDDVEIDLSNNEVKSSDTKNNDSDDVKKIDRDAKWRSRYKESKEQLEELKVASEREKQELLAKTEQASKANKTMLDKLVDAKIEAAAVAAGIKDIEFLKLMDRSTVKVDENGEVAGAADAIAALKSRKPELFGSDKKSSSSTNSSMANGATKQPANTRNAWDIPKDEWSRRNAFRGKFG